MSYPQKPWPHSRKKLWVRRGGGLQAAVGRANGSKGEDFGQEATATRPSGGDGSMNRRTMPLYLFVTLMILALLPSPAAGSVTTKEAVSPEAIEFFEKQIRPLLADKCYACHGPEEQLSSLRLDSRAAMLEGGTRGPSLIPGKPQESLLFRAVLHQELKMPLGTKLPESQVADLERWILMGAPWPDAEPAAKEDEADFYERISQEHWAYQPMRDSSAPSVERPDWSRNATDRFVLSKLKEAGLEPASRADPRTLARRLSFSLIGLPPDPEAVDELVADPSTAAYEAFVDRLLSSSQFGEHWARHWMDVVRFGETYGYEWNYEVLGAWRYRDYLIRAFNQDLPFDRFIREHIAGDLLPSPRVNQEEGIVESLIGAAFFRFGEMGHDDCVKFREIRTDVVDNQIDTLTRGFQGLTVACARCHDHKLDPIPTEDYYALYGILTSSRQVTRTLDTGKMHRNLMASLQQLKPLIQQELASQWSVQVDEIPAYLLAAHEVRLSSAGGPDLRSGLERERLRRWWQALEAESLDPESPLFPWAVLACETGPAGDGLAAAWKREAVRYWDEKRSRDAFNRENYIPIAAAVADWHREGLGLEGLSVGGDFALSTTARELVRGVYPAGMFSHLLSSRLNGAIRSPYIPKDKKFVSLRVVGGQLAAWRGIVDNCMLGENYMVLDSDSLSWVKIPNKHEEKDLPFYVELVSKHDNPRLPDRPGRVMDFKPEMLQTPGSYFGITGAVLHDVEESPREDLTYLLRLFRGSTPENAEEVALRYAEVCRKAVVAWTEGRADEGDLKWVDWLVQRGLLDNSSDLSPRLADLVSRYRETEARLARPKVISSMADLDPGYDFPVLLQGSAKSPGKPAPRRYLTLINGGEDRFDSSGSGRRALAELVASPDNPLTARVLVNRVWHHLFGRGIVATVDDFGRFGEAPSHPRLLDSLALEFVRKGWSIKKLIRSLVLSQSFQQSSQTSSQATQVDPQNRLLHHYPVRRLAAETIRDSILSTSGQINLSLYGPSIQPFRPAAKDYRKLLSGPLDGNGRRSLYLKVTRMEGPRFLELFDFPIPSVVRGRRDVTNVPSQALALLNDPFVTEQAARWADQLLGAGEPSVESRIDSMFRSALGRPAEVHEQERFVSLAGELASLRKIPEERILQSRIVWQDVAHCIFNLKEFIYLR